MSITQKDSRHRTPELRAWENMICRCSATYIRPKNYLLRGIKVCDEWRHDFKAFYDYMGDKPEPKRMYSLDRINNDGNYEPENCRWETDIQQQSNKRNTHILTAFGESKTLAEGPRDPRCVVSLASLCRRTNDYKLPTEYSIITPAGRPYKHAPWGKLKI